jgi:hypothetical protein
MPARRRLRSLVVVVVAVVMIVWVGAGAASAQDVEPPTAAAVRDRDRDIEIWALSGVDAAISDHWSGTLRIGYLGGFDSAVVLTDISYAPDAAKRLIIGHALIRPARTGAAAISVLRAGGAWLPLSGRVELEHQGLVERFAGDGRELFRLRNRLRLSVALPGRPPWRAFVSAEGFTIRESALNAYRYQTGATVSARHARIELYLLQHRVRRQPGFNAIGLSAIWTVSRRR